eukprot:TRINITY_DN2252_c0_g1_i10.p1 TRINITY_DN2252_c0_g1~~TRINITY_DN2252_c0_g1_i10.p1  ORF type:complete len:338 (+),score=78.01 TRINITY_DN2252_c0_g1_i10:52-1065(+)
MEQNFNGYALSLSEQVAVSSSLIRTQIEQKLTNLTFWGKIFGTQRDYLIAKEVHSSLGRIYCQYFFSVDEGKTFVSVPPVSDLAYQVAPLIRGQFTGLPDQDWTEPLEDLPDDEKDKKKKPIGDLDEDKGDGDDGDGGDGDGGDRGSQDGDKPDTDESQPQDNNDDDDDDDEKPNPVVDDDDPVIQERKARLRSIKEAERLAYTLQAIDEDCSVVPKGALLLTATKEVLSNPQFTGLTVSDAVKLSSYYHYRDARNPKIVSRLHQRGLVYKGEFLDSLSTDLPQGCWSIQIDEPGFQVSLRSLNWPGYFFSHSLHTNQFTSAYFGYGERCDDAIFML